MTIDDPKLRAMFTREALLASDWYRERLRVKQSRDIALWRRHLAALEECRAAGGSRQFDCVGQLAQARRQMARVSAVAYLGELAGTIGADPFAGQ